MRSICFCFAGWTGNFASIIESSMSEVADMLRQRAPFLQEVRRDGLTLGGLSAVQLLTADRRSEVSPRPLASFRTVVQMMRRDDWRWAASMLSWLT